MIRLSPKEVEVIQLSALLMTDEQIAARLGVAVHTVGARAGRAQTKLGVHCRAHAVALLLAAGVIKAPEPRPVTVVVPGSRLTEFAEDYAILRRRGLSTSGIAEVMGRKPRTVERMLCRARRAGLLPPGVASC